MMTAVQHEPESLTRAEVREVDRLAIEEIGIPGVVLMENAGIGATDLAESMLRAWRTPEQTAAGPATVAIVCGGGNNGGDGFVVGRHLALRGHGVVLFEAADPARIGGDAAVMRTAAERMGLELRSLRTADDLRAGREAWAAADLLVDGLLGTGFHGEMRADAASIVEAMVAARASASPGASPGAPLLALDLPSGLDADTGLAEGPCVRATTTVTFFARKRGFDLPASVPWTGEVVVKGIGAPRSLAVRARANLDRS